MYSTATTVLSSFDYFKTDLLVANYCDALDIERTHTPSTPSLSGSTQTKFTYNASNRAPRVSGECLHASFFANLNWSSLFDITMNGTTSLGAFASEFQKNLGSLSLCDCLTQCFS